MTQRIGCLHAHHSNIAYIDQALPAHTFELVHFVDPGMVHKLTADPDFDGPQARRKVSDQLRWMAECGVEAILITCTNYIATLGDDELPCPVIKIDEPFFASVCEAEQPLILLFTNPATVAGTMQRLRHFAEQRNRAVQVESQVIAGTFDLIMQGKKEQYREEVASYLRNLVATQRGSSISVAQLSMVEAAEHVEEALNVTIGNPLKPLAGYVESHLLRRQPG